MPGIVGFGVYAPRLRLERAAIAAAHEWFNPGLKALGRGTRAIACWDEDAITMAVEAARGALADAPAPASILLASTSAPFVERQNAGVIKEALALSDETATFDVGGSQRAGTSALIAAMSMAGQSPVLCIASEKARPQPGSEHELIAGDGAAALVAGDQGSLADFIGSHSVSVDFVDRFQAAGAEFHYGWEQRWIRDEGYGRIAPQAVRDGIAKLGIEAASVAHFVMPSPVRGAAARVAKAAGLGDAAIDDALHAQVGDVGAAQPLLQLCQCLEKAKPGEIVAVVSFGQGCDVLLFRTTPALASYRSAGGVAGMLTRAKTTKNYMQYLAFNDLIALDRGMRAEQDQKTPLTALYRERKTVLGLIGGRCTKTGVVQFPRSDIAVGQNDNAYQTLEDYRLADIPARILTHTADRLAYSPNPPLYYGMVEFEGGGRMVVEFADCEESDIAVGAKMRMMFRIKGYDERRKFPRYFWKAVPAGAGPV